MTSYEKELLALAYAECEKRHLRLTLYPYPFGLFADVAESIPESQDYKTIVEVDAATDEEGLTALLRDLGVEVPERPERQWVGGAAMGMVETYINAIEAQDKGTWTAEAPIEAIFSYLRDLYARDPLTALALLEGGEA